jgi:hypothetical protein
VIAIEVEAVCGRCGRPYDELADDGWNMVLRAGEITGLSCPTCQSPKEDMEAAVNEALSRYELEDGRIIARPKFSA